MLVKRRVVIEFAIRPGNRGATFIEEAGKDHVAAKTAVRTARGTFRKVGRGDIGQFAHNQSTIGRVEERSKILLLFRNPFDIRFLRS